MNFPFGIEEEFFVVCEDTQVLEPQAHAAFLARAKELSGGTGASRDAAVPGGGGDARLQYLCRCAPVPEAFAARPGGRGAGKRTGRHLGQARIPPRTGRCSSRPTRHAMTR